MGPKMKALTEMQREFIRQRLEHPNWTTAQQVRAAGYAQEAEPGSSVYRSTGYRLLHDPDVMAAFDEEADNRLKHGGVLGVDVVVSIAQDPTHKDQLKAALALMNRTGRHEKTESVVTIDDKRPKTKQELLASIREMLTSNGMSLEDQKTYLKKMTGEDYVDADFEVVQPARLEHKPAPTDDELKRLAEDL